MVVAEISVVEQLSSVSVYGEVLSVDTGGKVVCALVP